MRKFFGYRGWARERFQRGLITLKIIIKVKLFRGREEKSRR